MPRTYKFEGLVIKRTNIGESNKLLTVFTNSKGKINLVAYGIRKIHSRKSPHLELFNQISGFAKVGKNIDYIIEANTLRLFSKLTSDLKSIAFAYQIAEITNILSPEREVHEYIYSLLISTFDSLDQSKIPYDKILDKFILAFLKNLGYLPKNYEMGGRDLKRFLEETLEKKLKSDSLLTHLS